eukprot:418997_1
MKWSNMDGSHAEWGALVAIGAASLSLRSLLALSPSLAAAVESYEPRWISKRKGRRWVLTVASLTALRLLWCGYRSKSSQGHHGNGLSLCDAQPETLLEISSDGIKGLLGALDIQRRSKNMEGCDIILRAEMDGTELPSHSCLLAAVSPVLRREGILKSLLALEEGEDRHDISVLSVADADKDTLACFLDFCYAQKVDLSISPSTTSFCLVERLLSLSCQWQVESLKAACCEYFQHNTTCPTDAPKLLIVANQHGCNTLKARAKELLWSNFKYVVNAGSLNQLPLDLFVEVIESDLLGYCLENEICVFEAVVTWFLYQRDQKGHEGGDSFNLDPFEVLQYVRFPQIAATKLCTEVEDHHLMQLSTTAHLLQEAYRFLALPVGSSARNAAAQVIGARAHPRQAIKNDKSATAALPEVVWLSQQPSTPLKANDVVDKAAPLEGDKISLSKSSGAEIVKYADIIAPLSTTTYRATYV